MNNKGFATSTIIYMLIIVFSVLILSTVILGENTNKIENKAIEEAKNLLNVYNENDYSFAKTKTYRYMQAGGTWSSWTPYSELTDINSSISLTSIKNLGSSGLSYDLSPTDVSLVLENGEAYLDFNGTTSCGAPTETVLSEIVPYTIFFKFRKDEELTANTTAEHFLRVFSDTSSHFLGFGASTSALYNETITVGPINGNREGTVETFEADEIVNVVLLWDSGSSIYQIFINGVENPGKVYNGGAITTLFFDYLSLGCRSDTLSNYTDFDLYDIALSSSTITSKQALELSAGNVNIDDVIDISNIEIRYGGYIEFSDEDM